jgi:hypothetical protein
VLRSDKARGYCLEMICTDFLSGMSLEAGNRDALLRSLPRLVLGLPKPQRLGRLARTWFKSRAPPSGLSHPGLHAVSNFCSKGLDKSAERSSEARSSLV